MPRIQVKLLGQFRLFVGDEVKLFPTRKTESLFAYLLLQQGKPVLRRVLASMLWPDAAEVSAKKNLNTTLWRVKRALSCAGSDLALVVTKDDIALHLDHADVDLFALRSLLSSSERVRGEQQLEVLRQAKKLYVGELLEGLRDDWCEDERRFARGLYVGLLKKLVNISKELKDHANGALYAQELIALDPLDEDAHCDLMGCWYFAGNRTASLRQYEYLREVLRKELGVEPTAATKALWEHIRSNVSLIDQSRRVQLPEPSKEISDGFTSLPLVGRDTYLNALFRLLERASTGSGAAAILCGEAGVGKTKLVETLAVEAKVRGFEVLSGTSPDLKDPAPYQVFMQALWPKLVMLEHISDGAPPILESLITALAPDPTPISQNQVGGKHSLASNAIVTEALLNFLVGAHRARPMLLILEDVNRIDRASADLLVMLLGRVSKSNILVVVTTRIGEGASDNGLISDLISGGAQRQPLQRLSEEDSKKLIRAALRSKNIAMSVIQNLWHQTSGNPFFILEFLRLLCAEGTLIRDGLGHWRFDGAIGFKVSRLPLRVQEVIRRRIDLLSDTSRKTLVLAALLGMEVDFGLLRELLQLSSEKLADATEPLLNEHLLEETVGGFRFPHESIQAVALTLPSRARRRLLHSTVGELMERLCRGRTEDLSWHFEEAGDLAKASTYAEASGDKARSVHANNDAVYWYTHAFETLAKIGTASRIEILRRRYGLLVKRQHVLDMLGDRSNQMADIDSINKIGVELADLPITALAMSLRANLFLRLNASTKAIEAAREARLAFRSLKDVIGEARSSVTIGLGYLGLGQYRRSLDCIRHALPLFKQTGSSRDEAYALVFQGTVLNCLSSYRDALESYDHADQDFRKDRDLRGLGYSCMGKGAAYRFLGRARSSEAQLLDGVEFFRRVGDCIGEARCLIQLAVTQVALGKLRTAVYNARKALRTARQAGDIRAQIIILNNLGSEVYRKVGDFSRARRCLEEALAAINRSNNGENLSMYQESIAGILLDEGRSAEALAWSKASVASCRPVGTGIGLRAEIHYRLGCVHLELGNPIKAISYLLPASRAHKKCQEKPLQIRTLVALARAYLFNNESERALKCSRKAQRLLKTVDAVDLVPDVYWGLHRVLNAVGAHVAADEFLSRAHDAVAQQASGLKARMKTRFLTSVQINRQILEAAKDSWGQKKVTNGQPVNG